ncbi:MAG TPA: DUF1552 domain-containing protein [Polyangiaceae bacterium]|nr:DUF1552 domain-containing protein [Polyangiaceae bacterium]
MSRRSPIWQKRHNRRFFLGGAAALVGLPVLESIVGSSATAAGSGIPTRFMAFYVPCGMHMAKWTPQNTGPGYDLPEILAPLANVQNKTMVLSGLANEPAKPDGPGDHASGTGAFLTSAHPYKTEGADIKNGISMDQVAASAIGAETRIASLQLGIDGGAGVGGCDSGYSCAYARNISWASETQPLPKTINPQVVFDQIFDGFDPSQSTAAQARTRKYRSSLLDYVNQDAKDLSARLGQKDKAKLDEYLTGIFDLEQSIANATQLTCDSIARPDKNLSFPDHVKMMLDLSVLAMQCDVTRIVTFMLGNAGSGRNYDFIGVSGGHHQISHHQSQQANYDKLTQIDIWEVQQLAYLLEAMDKVQEGSSTLLDNTAVFFSSEIEDGNSHAHTNLPVVLAGGLGGALPTGQHLKFPNKTPLANMFVTILNGMGVPTTKFGNSTAALTFT